MSIPEWNIVLTAILTVVVAALGLWLRHVVRQQLTAKDTTIESLNATIKLHESHAAMLKEERAPALVEDNKRMREHVETVTRENHELEKRLKNLTEEQGKLTVSRETEKEMAMMFGVQHAVEIISNRLLTGIDEGELNNKGLVWFTTVTVNALQDLLDDIRSTTEGLEKRL